MYRAYARTSFRGAKTCKIGNKSVFWSQTNSGKDMTDTRKMHANACIYRAGIYTLNYKDLKCKSLPGFI